MRPVQAGRLKHRVVIEWNDSADAEPTGDGQPKVQWKTFATRWASVEPIETSGREYLQATAIESEVTHTVKMRYLDGVTAKHRINFGGRIFEIESTADIEERGRMLVIFCREQTGR